MHASKPATLRIRLAHAEDATGALAVYAPYVSTPVTFEEAAPSLEAFRARMAAVQEGYPYLVALARDETAQGAACERVVGYAYAHAQHEREAYRWNVELSVYLAPEAQGRGLGGALYRALIDLVRLQGMKAAYALVTVPNEASERLHASLGFQRMGLQRNAGFTCGAWRDVAWLVKPLAPFDPDPQQPLPFPALAATRPETVSAVLARANEELARRAAQGRLQPAHGEAQGTHGEQQAAPAPSPTTEA